MTCTADIPIHYRGTFARTGQRHPGSCPTSLAPGCSHQSDELSCVSLGSDCECACHHGWFQWPTEDR
jgi:hypothetical protein